MFIKDGLSKGLVDGISNSFLSIIDELSDSIYTQIEKTRLLHTSKKYSEFILKHVGSYTLFATNITANIDSAYVKVSITKDIQRNKYKPIEQIESLLRKQKIGEVDFTDSQQKPIFPFEAVNNSKNGFALIGNPGSGKTTAFRYLTILAAKGEKFNNKKVIPVFIPIRDLSNNSQGILNYIIEFFKFLEIGNPDKVLELLFDSGKIILFLDGLDESSHSHQHALLKELKSLNSKYPKTQLCISSRPYSLEVNLPDFAKWEVMPMDFLSRIEFIENWFAQVNPEKGKILKRNCQERPELLDIGSSPLFLSIVCALFNNDLELPSNIDELYSRCIDGMLGHWDSFRTIIRETDLKNYSFKERKIIVSYIAAFLFNEGKIVFSSEDIDQTQSIKKIQERIRKEIPTSDVILFNLFEHFGLLVERAPKLFSFSHLTIQEYLVAEYIVSNRLENTTLNTLISDDSYNTVLHFVIRMLPNADMFLTNIVRSIKIYNSKTIFTLIEIIKAKPICSIEIRKKIINFILVSISDSLNKVKRFLSVEFEEMDIVVTINLKKVDKKLLKELEKLTSKEDKTDKKLNKINSKEIDKRELQRLKQIQKKEKYNNQHFAGVISVLTFLVELTNIVLESKFDLKRDFRVVKDNDFLIKLSSQELSEVNGIRYVTIDE